MRDFLVMVTYMDPYPVTVEYRGKGGKIEVAVARALRQFREEKMKGRPIKQISVKATLL